MVIFLYRRDRDQIQGGCGSWNLWDGVRRERKYIDKKIQKSENKTSESVGKCQTMHT